MSNTEDDRFYDLLFEISNDIRHNILLLLHQKPERMTNIAKMLDLTSPEVSRHLSRLSDTRLIEKDSDNFYHVTSFGQFMLNSLSDLEFSTKYMDYFLKHSAVNIPIKFQKRMSEISNYKLEDNFMEFLRFITEKIQEAERYVWLYIDQYPVIASKAINDSVKRGVKYRIIEQGKTSKSDDIFDKKYLLSLEDEAPRVEVKTLEEKDVYLFLSDKGSAISFPTREGFDYTGFLCEGDESVWTKDLFEHYWTPADSTKAECALCSSPIRTKPIIETIDGKEYIFDTEDCVVTYKRLKQIYGERFT
jgi:predicted transcriptional regulator